MGDPRGATAIDETMGARRHHGAGGAGYHAGAPLRRRHQSRGRPPARVSAAPARAKASALGR